MAAPAPRPSAPRPIRAPVLFAERARIARLGRIRQFVFGSLDGLLVPLGVISGVAGGTGDPKAVIVAGIAEAFAGALSMGAGEFISGRSEAQFQRTEVAREMEQMRADPQGELEEMIHFLEDEGIPAVEADRLARLLALHPRAYAKTMIEKELGIPVDPELDRIPEALIMGVSYIAGSIFPLAPYFFLPIPAALPVSLFSTFCAAVIVGFVRGKLAGLQLVRSIGEIVLVGSLSALGGFLLGTFLPRLLGYS
ncbi:MAG: vacuolar iron transporter family protein [Chloroflexota bacterium]|jgi:VIT1/CCC1 family predicted Fe2+/Mn2+ transporter|nr:vacuolar iron transporter family protein [Chloroflexota bacterium]